MLPDGLPGRAAVQKAVINKLLNEGLLSTSGVPRRWIKFKKSVWGSGSMSLERLEEVERDEPVRDFDEDYCLPDPVPDKTWVVKIPNALPFPWKSPSQRILVRSEYHEAERAAMSADREGMEAFLVTGHPGIGLFSSCSTTRSMT
jgi:hypothetical protein